MEAKRSLGQRWEASRPTKTMLFWSCAGCAVATIVVGFTWGGWTTGGTARSMAQNAALGSRNELAAAVCADRFEAAADGPAQLVALKALDGWGRGSFVEKGGWAAMPDRIDPGKGAARLCADKLAALEVPMASAAAVQASPPHGEAARPDAGLIRRGEARWTDARAARRSPSRGRSRCAASTASSRRGPTWSRRTRS